jgi:hypothetical protein
MAPVRLLPCASCRPGPTVRRHVRTRSWPRQRYADMPRVRPPPGHVAGPCSQNAVESLATLVWTPGSPQCRPFLGATVTCSGASDERLLSMSLIDGYWSTAGDRLGVVNGGSRPTCRPSRSAVRGFLDGRYRKVSAPFTAYVGCAPRYERSMRPPKKTVGGTGYLRAMGQALARTTAAPISLPPAPHPTPTGNPGCRLPRREVDFSLVAHPTKWAISATTLTPPSRLRRRSGSSSFACCPPPAASLCPWFRT